MEREITLIYQVLQYGVPATFRLPRGFFPRGLLVSGIKRWITKTFGV